MCYLILMLILVEMPWCIVADHIEACLACDGTSQAFYTANAAVAANISTTFGTDNCKKCGKEFLPFPRLKCPSPTNLPSLVAKTCSDDDRLRSAIQQCEDDATCSGVYRSGTGASAGCVKDDGSPITTTYSYQLCLSGSAPLEIDNSADTMLGQRTGITDPDYEISLEGPNTCPTASTLPNNPTLIECRKKCDDDGNCIYFSYSLNAQCTIYQTCDFSTTALLLNGGFFFKKSIKVTTEENVMAAITELFQNNTEAAVAAAAAAAVGGIAALAAATPPPLAMFPPQGVPQPGGGAGGGGGGGGGGSGGGTLPATALANPTVAAEVTSLVSGLNGATTLAVFSSNLPGSFVLPRTVEATAVLIAEPPLPLLIPRTFDTSHLIREECPRPIINVGAKINQTTVKLTPFLNRISKITDLISKVQGKFSDLKSIIFQKLGLMCLIPKLMRPIDPFIKKFKCKLGLNEDGFMENPPCNVSACLNPSIENRPITKDRGLPNFDFMVEDMISTIDECFDDMEKVTYGSRVLAKLVDDESCDDPKYTEICKEAMDKNRIIFEDHCQTARCDQLNEDPFRSCFGCENDSSRIDDLYTKHLYNYYYYIDRQTGEMFQATTQSRRVICGTGPNGAQRCRLRIDRAMQFRRISYGRAVQFIQSEQYLSNDDVDIIRRI